MTDSSPLNNLSPSLKDAIASNLRRRSDLLSLALTHSTFCDVIIPFHLHYRVLYSRATNNTNWTHVLEDQRRARNVQSLHISTGYDCEEKTPWYDPEKEWDARSNRFIPSDDIVAFPNLRSYRFVDSQDVLGMHNSSGQADDAFWDAVRQSCAYLEEVDVEGTFRCPSCLFMPGDTQQRPSPLYKLKNLVSFRQVIKCNITRHIYDASSLHTMLIQCPDLRRLSLTAPKQDTDSSFFLQLRLPFLQSFELIDFARPQNPELLVSFLEFHEGLQKLVLKFSSNILPEGFESRAIANSLLHVVSLDTHTTIAASLFRSPPVKSSFALSSLRLNDVDLGDWRPIESLFRAIGQNIRNLSMNIRSTEGMKFDGLLELVAETCPGLRAMRITEDFTAPKCKVDTTSDRWASLLPKLSQLVMLDHPADMVGLVLEDPFISISSQASLQALRKIVESSPQKLRYFVLHNHILLVRPEGEALPAGLAKELAGEGPWRCFVPLEGKGVFGGKEWALYRRGSDYLRKLQAAGW